MLLIKGATIYSDPYNALILAIEKNKFDIIKILLEHGSDANAEDFNHNSALIKASEREQFDTVKILLEYGANVHAENKYMDNSLIIAAKNGYLNIFKELLNKGLNDKSNLLDALLKAAEHGKTNIVKEILEQENSLTLGELYAAKNKAEREIRFANEDSKCHFINTINLLQEKIALNESLINAAKSGNTKEMLEFLEKGALINIVDNDGNTPLMIATKNDHMNMVQTLLEKGVNIHATNYDDDNALTLAAKNMNFQLITMITNVEGNNVTTQDKQQISKILCENNAYLKDDLTKLSVEILWLTFKTCLKECKSIKAYYFLKAIYNQNCINQESMQEHNNVVIADTIEKSIDDIIQLFSCCNPSDSNQKLLQRKTAGKGNK